MCCYLLMRMARPKLIEDADLLEIAREVFVADGSQGSTRDIARQAGISEAALFKRYPTKAKLFLAAMMPPPVDADAMIAAAEQVADPQEALMTFADEVMNYSRAATPVIRQLTVTSLVDAQDIRERIGRKPAEQEIARALSEYISREVGRKRLRCADPDAAAMLITMSLHTLVLFELRHINSRAESRRSVRAMIAVLWAGMSPEAGRDD